jgi:hypothetical protein
MNGQPSLLSKGMSRPATASVSRTAKESKVDEEDYVDLAEEKGPPQTPREGVVRQNVERACLQSMGEQKVHPLLAQLGFDSAEISTLLRDELLSSFSGGRHEGSLADWKHFYSPVAANPITTTEFSFSLCNVAGGTAVNTRTTNTIALRKCRLRLYFNRVITGAATAAARDPNITVCVFRDKIPTAPGTCPTVRGTDSNPPSSATLLFSSLGVSTPAGIAMPVRNPITEDAYHIYEIRRIKFPTSQSWTYTGTVLGNSGPHSMIHDIDLDLNYVTQNYATYAASVSDINNLWCVIWADVDYTNYGFQDSVAATVDTEFEDKQL